MKKLKGPKVILPLLAAVSIAQAAFAQSTQTQTSSAGSLPKSDTGASSRSKTEAEPQINVASTTERQSLSAQRGGKPQTKESGLINACAAAVNDLKANRELVESLTTENDALRTRLETEKQITALLTELNETRKSETDALRETVTAKNEAIVAKDAVIASQDKLIETLKKKKSSPWKRLGDVLIGAALFAVLK